MAYASSKIDFKNQMQGISHDVQATDASDLAKSEIMKLVNKII